MFRNGFRTVLMILLLFGTLTGVLAQGQDSIAVGDSVTASATEDVQYFISLEIGQAVVIDLQSEDFDTMLKLNDANGSQILSDDDGGDGTNSLITFIPYENATYSIVVSSFSGAPNGSYTLVIGRPQDGGAINIGESFNEIATSNVLFDLSLEADATVEINLESDDFDAYLELRDSSGATLATDDDGGDGLDARLLFTAPANDNYTVIVRSISGLAQGAFTLGVGSFSAASTTGTISVGDTISETATSNINYTIELSADEAILINLSSEAFDSFLEIQDAGGNILASDDDSGGNLNARLLFTAPEDGTYTLVVRSYSDQANGAFTLSVEAYEAIVASGGTLEYGQSMTMEPAGATSMSFSFEGSAGDIIDLYAVSSADEDSYLYLYGPDGETVSEDDDGGNGTNPYIRRFELPQSGTYRIDLQGYDSQALFEAITITLEQSELLDITDTPVIVTLGASMETEIMSFEAVQGVQYLFTASASDDLESSLYINLQQPGEEYATIQFMLGGASRLTGTFTADASGTVRVQVDYYSYDSDAEITLSVIPMG